MNRILKLAKVLSGFGHHAESYSLLKIATTPPLEGVAPLDKWEQPSGLKEFWEAILWLRKNGVPAGDIIPENIMIDSSGQMKIADLGAMHMGS